MGTKVAVPTFNIREAKTQLPRLVDQAAQGRWSVTAKSWQAIEEQMSLLTTNAVLKGYGLLVKVV